MIIYITFELFLFIPDCSELCFFLWINVFSEDLSTFSPKELLSLSSRVQSQMLEENMTHVCEDFKIRCSYSFWQLSTEVRACQKWFTGAFGYVKCCRLVVIVNCQIPNGKTIHVVECTEVSETMASMLSVTAQAFFGIESRHPQRYLNSSLPGVIQSIKSSVKVHAFFLRHPAARSIFIYKIEKEK